MTRGRVLRLPAQPKTKKMKKRTDFKLLEVYRKTVLTFGVARKPLLKPVLAPQGEKEEGGATDMDRPSQRGQLECARTLVLVLGGVSHTSSPDYALNLIYKRLEERPPDSALDVVAVDPVIIQTMRPAPTVLNFLCFLKLDTQLTR